MTARRSNVFDRAASKKIATVSMSALHKIASVAGRDLSVSRFQHAELVACCDLMEQLLESLLSDYGTIALLADDIR